VTDVYKPDKILEAQKVFGANDFAHPAVSYLHKVTKEFYVGGKLQAISSPIHYDYTALRCSSSLAFSSGGY
jgi:sulfate adenylyltransferase